MRPSLAALAAAFVFLVGGAIAQQAGTELQPPPDPPPPAAIHDPTNADLVRLQPPQEAFSALPLDRRGKPDWVRALRERTIQPRTGVAGPAAPMPALELDIVMKNTAQMPYVKFPHLAHAQWLDCANCHSAIFEPRAGANPTNMARIFQGEACGVCHGKVAFTPLLDCERCHSVLQPGQKAWW
jgi:c(7)-type cytochrome triheme protein